MSINRRQLVAGTIALGQANLPFAFAARPWNEPGAKNPTRLSGPPKDLLSSTFTPSLLSGSLISASGWHPYPKVDEREAWGRIPEDIHNSIIQRAARVLGTGWDSLLATTFLEFKWTGNRSHFEELYFARRQRLTDLVLAECLEGQGRFLDEIVNGVWLICEESSWTIPASLYMQKAGPGLPDSTEPIMTLFSAETAATLSWIYYLLGAKLDQVSPLIRSRIQMEVKKRILDPGLERNDFWWMGLDGQYHRLNNWNPWINSNWMLANLLLEQDPSRRLRAMSKICRSLDQYLNQYSPDGGCDEGVRYWSVSACTYFDCAVTLASATGSAANILTNPFIAKMGRYIADVHIAAHYYVNYGDALPTDDPSPEMVYRFGKGVKDEVLEKFGAFYAPDEVVGPAAGSLRTELSEILCVNKARSAAKADALERDAWYPSLCLMIARAKAATTDGFYLAVQAAKNNRSHGHNDSGSFIIFHNGQPVFIDVGVEEYTAKTFNSERYSIWTMQSAYHNLPTIGGVMQSSKNDKYRASDIQYASDDAHATISMNLATAYPSEAGISHWFRNITLERDAGRIQLIEDFQLHRKATVALSFMTSRIPSQTAKGKIVLSTADRSITDVSLKYDASLVAPSFEKIVLKDKGLRHAWGDDIYRVLLTSTQPTDGGKWTMEIV